MPWSPADASSHTKAADTPALQKLWAKVANEQLQKTGDEGRAIRIANYSVKLMAGPPRHRRI